MINILNDSEIIMDWPHESIFTSLGYIKHPNTEVLVDRGKKECVAVYGESFAWGDNMDSPFIKKNIYINKERGIQHELVISGIFTGTPPDNDRFQIRRDNFSFRMNNNFGGYLTRMMDTDYYFSCVPGQGTTTTLYGLQNSIERLNSKYDKVYVIFQFTDPARDLDIIDGDSGFYKNKNNPHKEKIDSLLKDNSLNVDKFFVLYEQIFADRLNELKKEYANCQFVVWRNFTRWCGANFDGIIKIDEVMIEYYNMLLKNKKLDMPIMGPFWDELADNATHLWFPTEYKMREIAWRESSWNFMESNKNFYEGDRWGECGSYHPSPIGHKVWAEHIIKNIEEHNGKD
tara:strand:- start:32 stop:1063 length:1032 start_codon:yes stop_codon:yes gene_type:complete